MSKSREAAGRTNSALRSSANRVRVRVGALVFDDEEAPGALLLVEHEGLFPGDKPFWTPPGGEVEFGESLEEALRREVREETGFIVEVGALRYTLDFVRPPLHAVSFYFACRVVDGRLETGHDPELTEQLIRQTAFVPFEDSERLTIVPEGLMEALAQDRVQGVVVGTRYLGTKR